MSEKRKWFDPAPLQLPAPILLVSKVTREDGVELLGALSRLRGGDALRALGLFSKRFDMVPAQRLAVNLKTLLDRLAKEPVHSVIPDGLTDNERKALIVLQVKQVPPQLQEVAQGLLNIYERYLFLAAVGPMFRTERKRSWQADGESQ